MIYAVCIMLLLALSSVTALRVSSSRAVRSLSMVAVGDVSVALNNEHLFTELPMYSTPVMLLLLHSYTNIIGGS